jgi:nucleoprotein TPR
MAELDIPYLATTFSVPESNLQSLLNAPSVDLARFLLQHLSAFAASYDDLKAEKLRSDVELEAAIRSGESRARQLKGSVEKGLKETESLRRSLNDSGTFGGYKHIASVFLIRPRKCARISGD